MHGKKVPMFSGSVNIGEPGPVYSNEARSEKQCSATQTQFSRFGGG